MWSSNEFKSGAVGDTLKLIYSSFCHSDIDPDATICKVWTTTGLSQGNPATAVSISYHYSWWLVHVFERRGWRVEAVYLGNPMRHDEKYLLINQGFAGKQRLVPFFNRSNNEDLILAIQSAGVSRGRNGFRKDKSGEKLAESEEDLLEHRTDGTDAFDTLYIGCEKFPYHDSFSLSMSGNALLIFFNFEMQEYVTLRD